MRPQALVFLALALTLILATTACGSGPKCPSDDPQAGCMDQNSRQQIPRQQMEPRIQSTPVIRR